MRDTHKLKEKFELSLESSQIVTMTVALLVVLFKFLRAVLRRMSSFFGGSGQPVLEKPDV